MADADNRIVLLAGASGLTGQRTLEALLEAPEIGRVIAVSRRPLGNEHSRLANRIVRFDALESQLKGLTCEAALCCIGSTRRAAGSAEAFRAVDMGVVLDFARAARAASARRFVVISSVGADPKSRNLYLRTKGEMEQGLEALGFEALDILQPSLLLGWRREMRPMELAAMVVMPLISPLLPGRYQQYRAISARTVGQAMLGATRSGRKGVQRYTWPGIQALARLPSPRARTAPQAKAPARAR